MQYEGAFKSHDGLELFERGWEPESLARACVVHLHGYGEHCSRYAEMARVLNGAGFSVHTYDQRGFGRSPGKRGYINDFDVLLTDLDAFLAHVKPRIADRPWFLMGHSMGGLVLASYVETHCVDARGLIFSSSFLAFNDSVPPFLLKLADILGALAPWLPVSSIDNTRLSRDAKVVAEAERDPLSYHGSVRARTGAQFNAAIARARAGLHRINAPLYIIHGSDDALVPVHGSKFLYERCGSKDKTLKIYEGGYHELWNDLDKQAVFAGICEWLAARL